MTDLYAAAVDAADVSQTWKQPQISGRATAAHKSWSTRKAKEAALVPGPRTDRGDRRGACRPCAPPAPVRQSAVDWPRTRGGRALLSGTARPVTKGLTSGAFADIETESGRQPPCCSSIRMGG